MKEPPRRSQRPGARPNRYQRKDGTEVYPRERQHDADAQAFADSLLAAAAHAARVGLDDYCDLLDALYDGATTRLGLSESPVPVVPA